MNKKIKKVILGITAAFFCLTFSGITPVLWAFDDAGGEINSAAQKFSNEGLLGSFIYKYGRDRFRPSAKVSRKDLILVLGEYYNITQNIMNQNDEIMSRLENMEGGGEIDTDKLIREFQSVLDPMLQQSETIKELKRKVGEPVAEGSGSGSGDIDAEGLKEKIRGLEQKVEQASSKSVDSKAREKIDRLETKLENMETTGSGGSGGGGSNTEIVAKISQLEEKLNSIEESQEVSKKIDNLENKIEDQNKEMKKIARSGGSGEGAAFPFWARTSVGVSTLALFFMAR